MPLLARMVATPLHIDIRRGSLADLAGVLADQRISYGGKIAVVTSAGSAQAMRELLDTSLPKADWVVAKDSSLDTAMEIADQLRESDYDALVGVGGGRVLDIAKYVAARVGLPMISCATNLAHDGLASPVAILDNNSGRGSYGVPLPLAVIVDIDVVRKAQPEMITSGIGDALSNLSALADWELGEQDLGEYVDGLAVIMARTAADALLHREDSVSSDGFLVSLAEALVMSGLAMSVAGMSRPCSGACHEISHAIDRLFPERRVSHGMQVGVGAVFANYLRGDEVLAQRTAACLRRHDLPVTHVDLGYTNDEFSEIVEFAPQTRPGRYTILEKLDLTRPEIDERVADFTQIFQG